MLLGTATGCFNFEDNPDNGDSEEKSSLLLHYSLDESDGNIAYDSVSGKAYTINYVFNEQNADSLFKEPNDPLRKTGVKGNALYMDGFSNNIVNKDFITPETKFTMSAWVAPRVFAMSAAKLARSERPTAGR